MPNDQYLSKRLLFRTQQSGHQKMERLISRQLRCTVRKSIENTPPCRKVKCRQRFSIPAVRLDVIDYKRW